MGMDVCGRGNKDAYFRANVWSWRPIHEVIIETCGDLLPEKMLQSFGFNDGAGPKSSATCLEMADRIEKWIEEHDWTENDGRVTFDDGGDFLVDPDTGTFLKDGEDKSKGVSPYCTDREHLEEFVVFLRECQGFQVL